MGSNITKNQNTFQKSKSQVILPSQMNEIQADSNQMRSSFLQHKQKSMTDVVRQKIEEQQSLKGDDCNDTIFEENLFDQKDSTQKQSREQVQIDLNSDLVFEAKAVQSTLKISNSNSIIIPATISLKAKDPQVQDRSGLDLVCVIDRSGSMAGEKIKMVKETLKTLINFLSSKDRLSVILFSSTAEVLFKLKKATEEKKTEMRVKIEKIYATGGTNISTSLKCAFNLLKERKQVNQVTSVFLLSDGQDNESNAQLEQIFQNNGFPFTLHTFGYGEDHDANMMTKISKLGQGSFYFIKNLSLLDEFFADALGGLISVVGQAIDINIKCQPDAPFNQITIQKTYGSMWVQKEKGRNYQIQQNIIASGQRKDFVFELEIPQFQAQIENNKNPIIIIVATLKIQCPKTKNVIQKECFLKLNLISDDQIDPSQLVKDIDVIQQYYRVKGTEIIEKARRLCENYKFDEAKKLLKDMILEIESDAQVKSQSAQILEDLNQALQASEHNSYQQYGQTQMMQMVLNNYNQSGMSAQFNQQGFQLRSNAYYSSSVSRDIVNHIRSTKSTYDSEQI